MTKKQVAIVQLPELCPVAMEAMDRFENQDDFVTWLEEHAKTCEACKQLIAVISNALMGNTPTTE